MVGQVWDGETHNPDRREEQADSHAAVIRVDGRDDDTPIQLRANANAHHAKVHHDQRPQPPVNQHQAQVPPGPRPRVVHALQLAVMHQRILSGQRLRRRRKEAHDAARHALLARRQRPVGQPPQQADAQDDGEGAVHEEHPLEADEAGAAVHLLEAGADEPDDGGGDLGGGEVVADALASAARRVEEGEVVGHAGPHAGNDGAEQETQELEAPGGAHGGEAHADEADGGDDARHPHARREARHEQVGGAVEDDVGDVEEGQRSGGIARGQVQDLHEVVALGGVHGLGEADVGADGGAEEVEDPEGCEGVLVDGEGSSHGKLKRIGGPGMMRRSSFL